ncbi:hypothetical protein L1987_77793 [Smallanthus sonchifolius]|uniref:Uncharacterized protein n=1 Tax=Smallanthus sonchifolius TaxID=185202 RepID=A0ACB8ZB36_9ASTR|nr:hypothetical protein L1987_77793 [Smallanthus sonchifolius]
MATHEKHKKGVMHVYKLDTGNHHPLATPPPSTTKKAASSRSWGLLKRSKTYRETELNRQNYVKEEKKEIIEESARKSVSVIEGGRKSVSVMEFAGRRSVGNTAEMSVVNVAALLQVRVLVTDMPGFMQIHAFRCARQTFDSLEKFSPKQIALNLKKEFDKVYGPAWHCIVGSNFGSFVTHATGCFLYFSLEKLYILVFKTKVKKM